MARLWDKGKTTNESLIRFTVGDDHILDLRLARYDIAGSLAHIAAIADAGLISADEHEQLKTTYARVDAEIQAGDFTISVAEEDCHTAIEARVTELLGEIGAKVHVGRSRNDQVVTMMRLAMRGELTATVARLKAATLALVDLAKRHATTVLPGYTHLQRAMPSSVAAWALGYAEVLCERAEAILGFRKQLGRSALGSAAGYGVPLALSRQVSAQAQGYQQVQAVTAVQITRGLDELGATQLIQQIGIVVSRLAADVVLYATREFAFVKLPSDLTTGSSIMPNKANPDLFELMRGHGARLSMHPVAIASVIAGLPGGYQRDLQLVKKSLLEALDDCDALLDALVLGVTGMSFDAARCQAAMNDELYATAAACDLVKKGMPFREAYRKSATEPESWHPREADADADAADNPRYISRLVKDVMARLEALEASA